MPFSRSVYQPRSSWTTATGRRGVIGGEGWEEVADYALEWAVEHAAKQPPT
jgi:hypothetical protein